MKNSRSHNKGMDSIRYDSYGRMIDLLDINDSYVHNILQQNKAKAGCKVGRDVRLLVTSTNGMTPKQIMQQGDKFKRQVIDVSVTVRAMKKSIDVVNNFNYGFIAICAKIDAIKLNALIDACNDYVASNPQQSLIKNKKTGKWFKADTIPNIDFTGIQMV